MGAAKGGFDMARPDVQAMMNRQLDSFRERWGTFEWRTDGGWSPNKLKQDQGFRHVIRSFLDKHPDCAFPGLQWRRQQGRLRLRALRLVHLLQ